MRQPPPLDACRPDAFSALVSRYDDDGDGALCFDEFVALVRALALDFVGEEAPSATSRRVAAEGALGVARAIASHAAWVGERLAFAQGPATHVGARGRAWVASARALRAAARGGAFDALGLAPALSTALAYGALHARFAGGARELSVPALIALVGRLAASGDAAGEAASEAERVERHRSLDAHRVVIPAPPPPPPSSVAAVAAAAVQPRPLTYLPPTPKARVAWTPHASFLGRVMVRSSGSALSPSSRARFGWRSRAVSVYDPLRSATGGQSCTSPPWARHAPSASSRRQTAPSSGES